MQKSVSKTQKIKEICSFSILNFFDTLDIFKTIFKGLINTFYHFDANAACLAQKIKTCLL